MGEWSACRALPGSVSSRPPSTAWDQEDGALMHARDDRVDGLFRLDGASLSMLDHVRGVGVFWTASPDRVPRYERAAPLRALLDWWGGDHGCRVVHAGAVGTERGGALLVGKASGKSTAVLACLGSGLSYAGDDGVAVSHGARPLIHSLYLLHGEARARPSPARVAATVVGARGQRGGASGQAHVLPRRAAATTSACSRPRR